MPFENVVVKLGSSTVVIYIPATARNLGLSGALRA